MKTIRPAIAVLLLSAAGCAASSDGPGAANAAGSANATIKDAAGRTVANATLQDQGGGLRVRVEAAGLAPGSYGTHVHTTGRCEPPAFASAGPHWNPTARQHGTENPQGPHKGDLPNLTVDASGKGSVDYTIAGADLAGVFDADGAAVLIHAKPDDYRTDPSGNSGDRIACGVISRG
jgi:superoxide dismutase, Cu-Zn family